MDKKQKRKQLEEFGMEMGDINAIKFYELQASNKNNKHKKKEENDKT
ncbi:hypothetical protein ACFFF5_09665 [Lederbergia wuyishanensis]|uniref:Uncharacterized protein n=1 Tax=Lederbergia wuyishanensis TaxID=1347903 RepID=A0ABU0D7R4_9BACI|nr:hypothetical protein [Lederbergia wuyishanensis]MCJ8009046.1 hypothetical protein [Lederbergia wuyishanensis]MDQ0344381.1 hypothetical protein [Lederbergia wuyishanensis]